MNKKIIILGLLLSTLSFNSCVSTGDIIPGEKTKIINNIYQEYYNIADIYYNLEKYEKALYYYNLSKNNKKIYWQAFYKEALCYVASNNWSMARKYFEILLQRDEDNDSIKASLAYIYSKEQNYQKAKDLYKEILSTQENNAEYIENYLAILLKEEEVTPEIEFYYSKLETEFPDSKNLELIKSKLNTLKQKQETSLDETSLD